jgi:hypothetical protein
VFNDLRDGELRHICPEGEIARAISTPFDPYSLRITDDGRLFHAVSTKATDADGAPRRNELAALIESSTAQQLLEACEERDANEADAHAQGSGVVLRWEGACFPLGRLDGL